VRAEVVRDVVCSTGCECVGFMWTDKGADDIAPCLMFRGDVDKANLNPDEYKEQPFQDVVASFVVATSLFYILG
jgi:hypothetical protein